MKHVSILIPNGPSSLVNIEGTHQILSEVNSFLASKGEAPVFKIQLVGLSKETSQRNGTITISPDCLVGEVKKTDLIIIPALFGDLKNAMSSNEAFIPWIIQQYNKGAEVVSYCIGAFFLASTGLLKGRRAATHWMAANQFRNMFPEVNL